MVNTRQGTSEQKYYALCVQYRGSNFSGWQRQHGRRTIQGELERALSTIGNEEIRLSAAGRTDAGVHATGQVAAFSTHADRPTAQWLRGANGLTPDDIQVAWLMPVGTEFHPRYNAVCRRYTYLFHDQNRDNPFVNQLAWCTDPLDENTMHVAAQGLLGEHDFSSFRGAGCQSHTPMRRVDRCEVRREGALVVMNIEANAFLLHMVRNIASGLREVGMGAQKGHLKNLLLARDRQRLGVTAPPQGLYLAEVIYPEYDFPKPPYPPLVRHR